MIWQPTNLWQWPKRNGSPTNSKKEQIKLFKRAKTKALQTKLLSKKFSINATVIGTRAKGRSYVLKDPFGRVMVRNRRHMKHEPNSSSTDTAADNTDEADIPIDDLAQPMPQQAEQAPRRSARIKKKKEDRKTLIKETVRKINTLLSIPQSDAIKPVCGSVAKLTATKPAAQTSATLPFPVEQYKYNCSLVIRHQSSNASLHISFHYNPAPPSNLKKTRIMGGWGSKVVKPDDTGMEKFKMCMKLVDNVKKELTNQTIIGAQNNQSGGFRIFDIHFTNAPAIGRASLAMFLACMLGILFAIICKICYNKWFASHVDDLRNTAELDAARRELDSNEKEHIRELNQLEKEHAAITSSLERQLHSAREEAARYKDKAERARERASEIDFARMFMVNSNPHHNRGSAPMTSYPYFGSGRRNHLPSITYESG